VSHSVQNGKSSNNIRWATVTIINYVAGGESFSVADFDVLTIISAIPGQVAASQNSLGVPLFPVLDGGKVKLYRFTSGAPVEIATTANLNAVIPVVLFCGA
jgi:hypothetical protein